MAVETEAETAIQPKKKMWERMLSSARLDKEKQEKEEKKQTPSPIWSEQLKLREEADDVDRFLSALMALLLNVKASGKRFSQKDVTPVIEWINAKIEDQLNAIIHHPDFRELESNWRSLDDLIRNTNFKKGVMIDIMDVDKEELFADFDPNFVDITGSALFKKVYVKEYDQHGGKPFGSIIGLYEFGVKPDDITWLKVMGKIAAAAHAPFVAAVSPSFFDCKNMAELSAVKDVEALLNKPRYGAWNAFRDSEEAPYIGLTLPRYILRLPWHPDTNPSGKLKFKEQKYVKDLPKDKHDKEVRYVLTKDADKDHNFLWGNGAMLFARNLVRSFATSGWCQYLRGVKGGGEIAGLPAYTFNIRGEEEIKIPVEMVIPDYKELAFANSGFIPLVYKKGTADACFFSCQSLKRPKKFKDPTQSEDAQLVANLSYTLSITRIAHYVKCIMRDNIGSSADAAYIQNVLTTWLSKYVTTVVNPDDLTLRYYPFKAAAVTVTERPGLIGQYKCEISVSPHIQFEGLDAELRLVTRL